MRRPGVWVANGTPTDPVKMLSWRPGALTSFYEYLSPNKVTDYKQQHPEIPVIVRFQHPKNWHQDPTYWARQQGEMVASKWPDLQDMDPYVYFANEMNLHYENGDNNPGNQPQYETPEFYRKYANWVKMTADHIKQRAPDMKLVCPPFAFGHHEDGAPDDNGNPKDGWAGFDYLADTIQRYFDNIITFHAYWGHAGGSVHNWLYDPELSSWYAFRWRRVLNLFRNRYSIQARVIIDEAGNMRAADSDFTDQIMYHARQCLADERVIALTYFLWQDPTYHAGNIINSWVQRCVDLDDHVGRLAAMPDVPIQPTHPGGPVIRVLLADGTVKVLPVEEYLRGVVPAEMSSRWPMEALKAQAIAARSYAMVAIDHPRHHPNADICSTTHCQVYNPARINPNTDWAIQLTKGQVILYQGKLANAYYSANCGGQTVGNETAFGGPPLPHLRPVSCINPGPKNGHGVGMCQWGAHDMAERGDNYATILKHYYTGVTLSSEPTAGQGVIKGVVSDQAGTPQAGRQITLTGANLALSVITDSNGAYRFDNLMSGAYTVAVVGTDLTRPVWSDGSAPITLNLTLPSTPTPSQGIIHGLLRDQAGTPQAGRQITLTGPSLSRMVTTDTNGTYRFDALSEGTYTIGVVGTGLSRSVYSNGYTPITVVLTLPPAPTPTPGTDQGIIAGVLRDHTSAPQAGCQITLSSPTLSRSATTDGDGAYRFDGLPAGTYTIKVAGFEMSWQVESDGSTPVTLDLKPPPIGQAVISGVVRDHTGAIQPGRQIRLTGPGLGRTVTTDGTGAYRFGGLPQGIYTITVVGTSLSRNVYSNGSAPITLDLALPAL